jgi:hypothetical protein
VITGINTHLEHEGADYHIQIEDIAESSELEVRVYSGGRILFHKRHGYCHAVEGLANPTHIQTAVKDELGKLLALVKAAIHRGRINA